MHTSSKNTNNDPEYLRIQANMDRINRGLKLNRRDFKQKQKQWEEKELLAKIAAGPLSDILPHRDKYLISLAAIFMENVLLNPDLANADDDRFEHLRRLADIWEILYTRLKQPHEIIFESEEQ
jgi:hypothetical protein